MIEQKLAYNAFDKAIQEVEKYAIFDQDQYSYFDIIVYSIDLNHNKQPYFFV